MDMNASLQRAIDAAGSQQRLAESLGIRSASISEWKSRGRVPAERVLAIETETGVSRHELRPDVFGPDPSLPSGRLSIGQIRSETDMRMSKRALRARLGLASDKHLATLLQLPTAQVEGWPEEGVLPALPQIQRLLGGETKPPDPIVPTDFDHDRITQVDVA